MESLDFIKLLDSMPLHVYWKDKSGVYLGCNLNQARDFGFNSQDDITGKTDFDLITNQTHAKVCRNNDVDVMRSNVAQVFEEIVNFDNTLRTMLSYKSPMHDEAGDIIGLMGISIDITEQKALEKKLSSEKK